MSDALERDESGSESIEKVLRHQLAVEKMKCESLRKIAEQGCRELDELRIFSDFEMASLEASVENQKEEFDNVAKDIEVKENVTSNTNVPIVSLEVIEAKKDAKRALLQLQLENARNKAGHLLLKKHNMMMVRQKFKASSVKFTNDSALKRRALSAREVLICDEYICPVVV